MEFINRMGNQIKKIESYEANEESANDMVSDGSSR